MLSAFQVRTFNRQESLMRLTGLDVCQLNRASVIATDGHTMFGSVAISCLFRECWSWVEMWMKPSLIGLASVRILHVHGFGSIFFDFSKMWVVARVARFEFVSIPITNHESCKRRHRTSDKTRLIRFYKMLNLKLPKEIMFYPCPSVLFVCLFVS